MYVCMYFYVVCIYIYEDMFAAAIFAFLCVLLKSKSQLVVHNTTVVPLSNHTVQCVPVIWGYFASSVR